MSNAGAQGLRADAVRNRQLALDGATQLLAERGASLTVEAIAKRSGLGAATVVRAFGGKDALLDAAVAGLLRPLVQRGRQLHAQHDPDRALRTFLGELIAFQSAYHPVTAQLRGLDLPATSSLRADLVRCFEEMIAGAREQGTVRADIDAATLTELISQSGFAIARSAEASPDLAEAFVTVLMDGLRPQP